MGLSLAAAGCGGQHSTGQSREQTVSVGSAIQSRLTRAGYVVGPQSLDELVAVGTAPGGGIQTRPVPAFGRGPNPTAAYRVDVESTSPDGFHLQIFVFGSHHAAVIGAGRGTVPVPDGIVCTRGVPGCGFSQARCETSPACRRSLHLKAGAAALPTKRIRIVGAVVYAAFTRGDARGARLFQRVVQRAAGKTGRSGQGVAWSRERQIVSLPD